MRSRRGAPRSTAVILAFGLGAAAVMSGCYTGSARDVSAGEVAAASRDPAWQLASNVPFVPQKTERDCGAAALTMVLRAHGVPASPDEIAIPDREGARAGALRDVARAKGLQAFVVSGTLADLFEQVGRGRPVLVGLAKPITGQRAITHYEVVVGVNRSRRLIRSLDPARGLRENTLEGFAREWVPTKQVTIVVFRQTPAPAA